MIVYGHDIWCLLCSQWVCVDNTFNMHAYMA